MWESASVQSVVRMKNFASLSMQNKLSEDSYQTVQIRRLYWILQLLNLEN